jgi:hypothetical protein
MLLAFRWTARWGCMGTENWVGIQIATALWYDFWSRNPKAHADRESRSDFIGCSGQKSYPEPYRIRAVQPTRTGELWKE